MTGQLACWLCPPDGHYLCLAGKMINEETNSKSVQLKSTVVHIHAIDPVRDVMYNTHNEMVNFSVRISGLSPRADDRPEAVCHPPVASAF